MKSSWGKRIKCPIEQCRKARAPWFETLGDWPNTFSYCFKPYVFYFPECNLNVQIIAPARIIESRSISLLCLYDLHDEPLYSVKWYRGTYEFFRYEPKEKPRCKFFPLPAYFHKELQINIDVSIKKKVRLPQRNNNCELVRKWPHMRTCGTRVQRMARSPLLKHAGATNIVPTHIYFIICSLEDQMRTK